MLNRRAELRRVAEAEQGKLNDLVVIADAESTVGGSRITELHATCCAARRRVSAARAAD